MTTGSRDSRGRFLTATATDLLRRSSLFGLSRAEQAPFAAAIILFAAILGVLSLLALIGAILAAILPQVGTGLLIGALIGFFAMGRRAVRPRGSTGSAIVVSAGARSVTPRR